MLRTLVAKDLRRARRNPVPWLTSLVVPLVITALLGAIFSPRAGGGLGQIRVAFVDEDDTGLGKFLQGAMERMKSADAKNRPPAGLELVELRREEALRRVTEDEFAAAVIIPAGFTDAYLDGTSRTRIELVKNPARAVQPRVVEEGLGLLVTVLNSFRDLAGQEAGEIRRLLRSDDDLLGRFEAAGALFTTARQRLEPARAYLAPPLVAYNEEKRPDTTAKAPGWSLFAYLLAGMAAMFLLFLVDHAMRDLYREMRGRTLERFATLHDGLLPFVAGKVLFAVAMCVIGAVILLGGGSLVFQFAWRQPLPLAALVVAYAFCGAGLIGLFGALAGSERRADLLGNVSIMTLSLCGGCMFPPEALPAFMREHLTPLMPTGWFASAVRELQDGGAGNGWVTAAMKLAVLGTVTVALATLLFRRRLQKGVRA